MFLWEILFPFACLSWRISFRTWSEPHKVTKAYICFNLPFPYPGCGRHISSISLLFELYPGNPKSGPHSQWDDLAAFLLALTQHLLVEPHLMHLKCVLIWWLCLRHSLHHILFSLMTYKSFISRINLCILNFSLLNGSARQVLIGVCVGPMALHMRVLSHCSCSGWACCAGTVLCDLLPICSIMASLRMHSMSWFTARIKGYLSAHSQHVWF